MFPLNSVLLPGMALPLRVFEPRYRELMRDLLGDEIPGPPGGRPGAGEGGLPGFGVARIRRGLEVGGSAETARVGTFASIAWVRGQDDGTLELLTRGTRRFRITDRLDDDPYPRAVVTFLEEPAGSDPQGALAFAQRAFARYRLAVGRLLRTEPEPAELPDGPVDASYALAAALTIEPNLVQALLEVPDATERLVRGARIARSEANILTAVGPPARQAIVRSTSLN